MTAFRVPRDRLETQFADKNPLMTRTQALAEANRCLYCFDAPCIQACPTGINIPEFIRRIASGNVRGAAKTILSANMLGYSCARVCPVEVLCEGDCVYNVMDQKPIEIGRLQRYATEDAYDRGIQFFEAGAPTGKRVALMGAGPASLACAHEAVVFEGEAYPGGINTNGVAPYKLYAHDSLREAEYIRQIGFEIRYETRVGRDVSFAQLENEFDAIFLGIGLGRDGWLGLEGEDLPGVVGALDAIEKIKLGGDFSTEHMSHAVVVGAGNTAMDIVQELLGLGAPRVTLMYRRGPGAMSGYEHEWVAAKKSGARAMWWTQPVAYEGGGQVERVRFVKTRPADPGNPRSKVLYDETQQTIDADFVAIAVGQERLEALVESIGGVALERGRIVVDPESGQTSHPKYFSGGDCANGGKEVVNAAAEGKRAAHGIHRALSAEA